MTPREKAEEIHNKFYNVNHADGYYGMTIYESIQCAIIAVEEIIKESNLYDQTMGYNGVEFWEEVLTELKSMQ